MKKWKKHQNQSVEVVLGSHTPFVVQEAYKTIRTNLLFTLNNQTNHRVMVTSSLPGEGKSTTCVNLAISLSQLGKKVLLIDTEMRKPTVHKKLRLRNQYGLSTILGGFCTVEEGLLRGVRENLDVITAGAIPPNPSELLSSPAMGALLDALDTAYDYLILDTPPVNVVSDSLTLSPLCAGIVLVVRLGSTRHEDLQRAVSSLTFSGTKILGLVSTFSQLISSQGKSKDYRYQY